jgi:hypothetical protein
MHAKICFVGPGAEWNEEVQEWCSSVQKNVQERLGCLSATLFTSLSTTCARKLEQIPISSRPHSHSLSPFPPSWPLSPSIQHDLSVFNLKRTRHRADINPIAIKSLAKRADVENEGGFW